MTVNDRQERAKAAGEGQARELWFILALIVAHLSGLLLGEHQAYRKGFDRGSIAGACYLASRLAPAEDWSKCPESAR